MRSVSMLVICACALATGAVAHGCGQAFPGGSPCSHSANALPSTRGYLRRKLLDKLPLKAVVNHHPGGDPFRGLWARAFANDHEQLVVRKLRRLQRSLLNTKKAHLSKKPFVSRFVVESSTDPMGRLRSSYRYEDSDGRVITDGTTRAERGAELAAAARRDARRRQEARRRVIAATQGRPEPVPEGRGRPEPVPEGPDAKTEDTASEPDSHEVHQSHDVLIPAAATTATAGAVGYFAVSTAAARPRASPEPPARAPDPAEETGVDVVNTDAPGEAGAGDAGGGSEFEDDSGGFDSDSAGEGDDDDSEMEITDADISDTDYSPWTDVSDEEDEEDEDGVLVDKEGDDDGKGGAAGYYNTRGDFVPY